MYLILVSVLGARVYQKNDLKSIFLFLREIKSESNVYFSIILNCLTILSEKIENIVIYLAAIEFLKQITFGCHYAVCVNKILSFAAHFYSQIPKLLLKFNNHFISNEDQEEKS